MIFNLTLAWLNIYTVEETALLVINECEKYDPNTPERKTLEFINTIEETALLIINECEKYDLDTPERNTLEFINDVFLM